MPPRGPNQKERVNIIIEGVKGEKIEELPFIVGVLADLRGSSAAPDTLHNRNFENVNSRKELDIAFNKLAPSLRLRGVTDKLSGQSGRAMDVDIDFKDGVESFDALSVAKAVPAINNLLDARQRLAILLDRLGRDPKMAARLQQLAEDPEAVKQLLAKVGGDTDDGTNAQALGRLIDELVK